MESASPWRQGRATRRGRRRALQGVRARAFPWVAAGLANTIKTIAVQWLFAQRRPRPTQKPLCAVQTAESQRSQTQHGSRRLLATGCQGHQQQRPAQHLVHAVQSPDGGGGVHARQQCRHVSGGSFHGESDRLCGDRHGGERPEQRRHANRPEHHLTLRLPHHVPAHAALHRPHLRGRLRLVQEHLPRGESRQVEDARRADGRPDHQRRAGDAPSPRLQPGLQARRVAGDLRVRECLHAARDALGAAAGKDGGGGVSGAGGRLADRSVRRHAAVAHGRGLVAHAHPQASGGPAAGDQRGAAAVPRGLQHAGLPLHAPQGHAGREAAVGLPALRPRARLPRLGQSARGAGRAPARMPHVSGQGALRAPVAGLRGRFLRGRRAAHARLRPLRPRLLREDGRLLESDPAAPRHAHLPRRLPLLCPPAEQRTRLRQTHLPRTPGLEDAGFGPLFLLLLLLSRSHFKVTFLSIPFSRKIFLYFPRDKTAGETL
ncbi:E3 ubiquitin-protein ligase pellino homolog 1b isoform X1 [Festucalex cinctus]